MEQAKFDYQYSRQFGSKGTCIYCGRPYGEHAGFDCIIPPKEVSQPSSPPTLRVLSPDMIDSLYQRLASDVEALVKEELQDNVRWIIRDNFGKEYNPSDVLLKNLYPIYWETLNELYKDDPSALNGLLAFYAFLGGGVSVYGNKTDEKRDKKSN